MYPTQDYRRRSMGGHDDRKGWEVRKYDEGNDSSDWQRVFIALAVMNHRQVVIAAHGWFVVFDYSAPCDSDIEVAHLESRQW